ncbi:integrase [Bradyrhizobium algeriense]|uniref:Integrase n=1 Tax=Bradyrhizobium algeriense TaxID=634784 RepID=A0ABU8BNU8_9BRAD
MSSKTIYERESRALTDNDVQSAISYSNSKWIIGKISEWRDTKTVGLTLRITPGKVVWYVRRREITLRLGLASDIDLDAARYFSEQTHLAAKRKRNLREFVETLVHLETSHKYKDPWGSAQIADQFADETSLLAYRKRIGDTGATWTWKALTQKFLAYQLPRLKPKYRKQYEHYLTLKEFSCINDKLVGEIRLRDLERLRDEIHLNHAASAVHRALTQSKRMLTWAWKYQATASGLDEVQAEWWTRWSFEYKTKQRTHAPTIEEIARALVIAEKFRNLADGEHETYPGTIGALWGVALTAQRTGAFLQLRLDRLFEASRIDRKLRGWKIANWTSEEMKGGRDGGRPHSLPIPPAALKVMATFHREAGGKSSWMFPGRDVRNRVTPAALNLLMYRLQGRVYDHTVRQKPARKGKPGPKPKPRKMRPDLFKEYGIRPFTLHDVRRTVTTFLDDRRLGGAATAILGHKTAHSSIDEREQLASVTEQHYNRSQKIDLKAEGMAIWVKTLLAACYAERRKLEDSRAHRRRLAA